MRYKPGNNVYLQELFPGDQWKSLHDLNIYTITEVNEDEKLVFSRKDGLPLPQAIHSNLKEWVTIVKLNPKILQSQREQQPNSAREMRFTIQPQYNKKGEKYELNDPKQPCWENVCLCGPVPSNSLGEVSAVDDDRIVGNIYVQRQWFGSNGFCLVGYEQVTPNTRRYQEWWVTLSRKETTC